MPSAWNEILHVLPTLIALALVPISLMAAWYWSGWRLQQVLARPFPTAYRRILQRHLPLYKTLPPPLARQLRRLIRQFLYQKKFIGCGGLEMTDEIRVTIAAQACLLLLERPTAVFPKLEMVLVYPTVFVVPRTSTEESGVVNQGHADLAGESWSDGRVILAWDQVRQGGVGAAHNVVLHEFAHQLDSEGGVNNGAPLLPNSAAYQRWAGVFQDEFARLQQAEYAQTPSVLDYYGAQNPAEFFAVATETFFMNPVPLSEEHPLLYQELRRYYRVDPRVWH
jgi:hypothetical protein